MPLRALFALLRPLRVQCLLLALLLPAGIASAQRQGANPTQPPHQPGAQTETGGVKPPPLGPPPRLHLPPIVQKTLPNGLRILLLEDHTQPALWLRLAVPAGTIRDPKDRVGLAEMAADLLNKSTTTRTATQIADTVDSLGATLSASAEDDFLIVAASGLSVYTDALFDLAADITLHPTFPEAELERARTRTLNAIRYDLSQPATMASAAFDRLVYGAHPYGNYTSGTPATLRAITREDLQKFHDTYFAPNAATLFLVGDITPEQAEQKAQAAFGVWERKEVPSPPSPPTPGPAAHATRPQITLIDRPGAAQTEIRIGTLTPGYRDPNRIVGTVATAVLGLGQFEGRLTKEIRVKRGLTYGVASYFSRNAQAGTFQISTFTKNASTAEVIQLALQEGLKLSRELTPPEELQERKDFLNGYFAVSVATPPGVLTRLIPAVLYGNGPSDLTQYTQRVQAVTPQQIRTIMSSLNLEHPQIVLVGDAKAIESAVRPLGSVTVIPFNAVNLLSPTLQGSPTTSALSR